MRHLDLFSGIGGFALAARWLGINTIGFCEIDPWARDVLNKNFSNIPIHDDIKTIKGDKYGSIDIITGGYPCQPFSVAGKQRGTNDDRHLWPEMLRVIQEARPTWILCENVAGHIKLGLDKVLFDLEAEGYGTQPLIIPACATDKVHRRDRVWIIANSNSKRGNELLPTSILEEHNSKSKKQSRGRRFCSAGGYSAREAASRMLRKDDGVPFGVDRNRGLGNAIVPQVAYEIMKVILFLHNN